MKLIDPGYEILNAPTDIDMIENAARTCYKSEANNNGDKEKTEKFVKGLIKRGHEAMLEHSFLSVKFTTDRGVSHEIVRNRLFSFAQESTRYCNYNNDDDILFVKPYWYDHASPNDKMIFEEHLEDVEKLYNYMIGGGHKPQAARAILPNCLKTEIVVSGNYREWRHFLKLRAANSTGPAHPDMNRLVCPLLIELHEKLPVIFDDVYEMMLDDKEAAKWVESYKI